MRADQLPTADQILVSADGEMDRAFGFLSDAYRAFGDASDWLRSDWRPVGSSLTEAQASTRIQMREVIAAAKRAINQLKNEAGR